MFKKVTQVFDNDNIVYSNNDFDADVILNEDLELMSKWANELGIDSLAEGPIEIFNAVKKIKKNKYKRIKPEQLKYFNRCSWLSLKRKGHLLIESFIEQFVPKIERVIAVQKHSVLKSEDGDVISGKIDMILKIRGHDKPIIFDLKTASRPYTQKQIDSTEQLALYAAMEAGRYGTDQVGYVVLSKAINKDKVSYCISCGHKKEGRHRTCDYEIHTYDENGAVDGHKRCNGEWEEKTEIRPLVQVLIEKKTDEQIYYQLSVETQTIEAMKAGVVYKNTSMCESWFGSRCPYFDLCHKGDDTGLLKRS